MNCRALDVAHVLQVLDLCVHGDVPSDCAARGCHLPHHLHGPLLVLCHHLPGKTLYSLHESYWLWHSVCLLQLCYRWWRLSISVFWWIVIIYSMIVLCVLYTYQFDEIPWGWVNRTSISKEMLGPFLSITFSLNSYSTTYRVPLCTQRSNIVWNWCLIRISYLFPTYSAPLKRLHSRGWTF
jgi:hypothetical protein